MNAPPPDHVAAPPAASPREWVVACRPRQWAKNVFVLAPALFSHHLADPAVLAAVGAAFACFCAVASAGYLVNDVLDRDADARHPRKRNRPVAAGRIAPAAALAAAGVLSTAGFAAALAVLPRAFAALLAMYLANTLLYALVLKHRVIIDVLAIAVGFVIRLLAGCAAAGVLPSSWLILCGFALALTLGFGKRRAEVEAAGVTAAFRPALASYGRAKLDTLLAVNVAVCLLAYMLYTVAPETVARHGTDKLVYTVPLVAYGLFRYLFKCQEAKGDGPTEILTDDPVFLLTGVAWGVASAAILAAA